MLESMKVVEKETRYSGLDVTEGRCWTGLQLGERGTLDESLSEVGAQRHRAGSIYDRCGDC
eukprot:360874-Chlamydomonas_euryale.AAC.27